MVLSTRQMSVSCAIATESTLAVPPRACKVRDTHVRCRASMRRLPPLRHAYVGGTGHVGGTTVEVPAGIKFAFAGCPNLTGNAFGGAPPCAARTCLLRSHRRRSTRSSYCTLFNNRCVLSACTCVSQNTHRRRASAVRFSAFRLPNPTQTRRREVHGGL